MNPTALRLPSRATKPRSNGLTMVIDGGITLNLFADVVGLETLRLGLRADTLTAFE